MDQPDVTADAELLTASEVGQRLRLPLSTVYYLAKQGKLPCFRVGRSWRFLKDEIERITEKRPYASQESEHADRW